MGLFRRGKWRTIRADYANLPQEEWTEDEMEHWFQNLPEEEAWAQWDRWSRDTFEHPSIKKVRRSVLELANEAARDSYPLEFACMLRVEGDTVTEVVLLPGTVQGDEHALLNLWMQPVDRSVNGTLHSHPDTHPYPSDDDFALFEQAGAIHIILAEPYDLESWRAYSHDGVPTYLEVVEHAPKDGGGA